MYNYSGIYPTNGDDKILGRGENDHERLFPKYTTAQAASRGEVIVNGKTLKIWDFSQLETLKPAILRSRAMALRDAVGEANCPPMPSAQASDMIRWILHMQSLLAEEAPGCHRNAMQGSGPPPCFIQESQGRPILDKRPESPERKNLPFGPRKIVGDMETLRDHYSDILGKKKEFAESTPHGIATLRVGGEGRRHIFPKDNMVSDGVSTADPVGVESMKDQGEGRKYLNQRDHMFEQQWELEGVERGVPPQVNRPRQGPESQRRGGQGMGRILNQDDPNFALNDDPIVERPIGGERKKHTTPEDHMLNNGIADAVEVSNGYGRKHVDNFAGHTKLSGTQAGYKATWKQDPSRLLGTSLII